MPITEAYLLGEISPPSKVYVHSAGRELFPEQSHLSYFKDVAKKVPAERYNFLIGIVWGDVDRGQRVADIFGFRFGEWRENPEVSSLVYRDGRYVLDGSITCGEGLIVLGEEMKLRRRCESLEEYMTKSVDLKELGLLVRNEN